jgi:hypothetical protein
MCVPGLSDEDMNWTDTRLPRRLSTMNALRRLSTMSVSAALPAAGIVRLSPAMIACEVERRWW